ncbi:hypothetical protein [Rhizobium rhizogenes]|uniref:hypothetical protein n=1 Tax=Rhizobium rhizogenes TaxID=359 RepID=UPI00157304DC|nr:hypothetical protein [Rhizobium rhizogenes]NTI27641.1 hypothetical protein [Rhizobium rhizogenes]
MPILRIRKSVPEPGNPAGFSRGGNCVQMREGVRQRRLTERNIMEARMRAANISMKTDRAEQKARRDVSRHTPGASWRRHGQNCAGETIRAGKRLNPARVIGGLVCGQRHQWKRGASFGGLLNWNRARHVGRPIDAIRPMCRKPEHGALESARCQIAAFSNIVELRAAIEHDRRYTLAANSGRLSVSISNNNDLFPKHHAATNAVK